MSMKNKNDSGVKGLNTSQIGGDQGNDVTLEIIATDRL